MENSDLFYKISDELKLGTLKAEPQRVAGGSGCSKELSKRGAAGTGITG